MTNFAFIKRHTLLRVVFYRFAAPRAQLFADAVEPFLPPKSSVLDVGAGICDIDKLLVEQGHVVTALDIQDISFNDIKPVLYDGTTIPFENRSFDVALIITVLHHTQDPLVLIDEAKRVAKQVIIIEDVYFNVFQKYLTFFVDSLLNFEFSGHPHSNKSDEAWRRTFESHGLHLTETRAFRSFLVMRHRTYVLDSIDWPGEIV